MPLPIIAGTVRAAVRGTQSNGKPWVNVWHLRKIGAPPVTAADIAAWDAQFVKFYIGPAAGGGNFWLGRMGLGGSLQDITYTPLDGTSPSTVVSHAAATSGGAAAVPGEVAFVLTLRTQIRGRRYRGRIYLAGLDKALLNNDGTATAATISNATLQIVGVQALLTPAGAQLVVASYRYALATDITQYTMDGRGDMQRRRK